jgi:penicillin amidase
VPYDELPSARGTPDGILVTANECIVEDGYPHHVTHEWLNPYRAERIRAVLGALDRVTVEDCVRLQVDVHSIPGLRLRALLAGTHGLDASEHRALELLRDWDGDLSAGSPGGAVAGVLLRRLTLEVYAEVRDELGRFLGSPGFSLLTATVPFFARTTPALLELLERRDDGFFRDGRTWDDVVGVAVTRTVRELELTCGPDPRRWTWGAVHPLVLDHPLAVLPGVGRRLRRGPFALGGDADTVAQAWYPFSNPMDGRSITGASMRFVADLADPDRSRFVLAGGQSGHPADPAYDDHLDDWLAGRTRAVAWSEAAVERSCVARLTLTAEH